MNKDNTTVHTNQDRTQISQGTTEGGVWQRARDLAASNTSCRLNRCGLLRVHQLGAAEQRGHEAFHTAQAWSTLLAYLVCLYDFLKLGKVRHGALETAHCQQFSEAWQQLAAWPWPSTGSSTRFYETVLLAVRGHTLCLLGTWFFGVLAASHWSYLQLVTDDWQFLACHSFFCGPPPGCQPPEEDVAASQRRLWGHCQRLRSFLTSALPWERAVVPVWGSALLSAMSSAALLKRRCRAAILLPKGPILPRRTYTYCDVSICSVESACTGKLQSHTAFCLRL